MKDYVGCIEAVSEGGKPVSLAEPKDSLKRFMTREVLWSLSCLWVSLVV